MKIYIKANRLTDIGKNWRLFVGRWKGVRNVRVMGLRDTD